ncbi:MAG: hypothetical protein AAGK09_09360 [Planctomycetota bacterium]
MSRPTPRRRHLASPAAAACTIALAGLGVGCDSEQAQADRALRDGIAQVRAAERGFAPASNSDGSAFRQEALAGAITPLSDARRQGGAGGAAAAQLAAQLHASAANAAVGKALSAYAALAPDAAGLVSAAATAQLAASDSTATIDRSEGVAALRAQIDKLNTERDDARRAANEFEARVTRLTDQAAGHRTEASQALAESRRLNGEALAASSSRSAYDLEEQAAEAELASLKASVAAERVDADLNLASAQFATARARVAEAESALARVQQRLGALQDRGQAEQAAATQAGQARDAAIASLTQSFDEVTQRYAAEVDAIFVQAVDEAAKAVDAANAGVSLARGGSATAAARRDLIAAHITDASVLAQRALTAGMFTDVTFAVSEAIKPIDSAAGDKFGQNAAETDEIARTASAQAMSKLDEALTQANNLNNTEAAALAAQAQAIRDTLTAAGF